MACFCLFSCPPLPHSLQVMPPGIAARRPPIYCRKYTFVVFCPSLGLPFQKIISPVFQFAEICARLSDGLPVACWKDLPRPAGVSVKNPAECPQSFRRGVREIPPFSRKTPRIWKRFPAPLPVLLLSIVATWGGCPLSFAQKFRFTLLNYQKFPRGCPTVYHSRPVRDLPPPCPLRCRAFHWHFIGTLLAHIWPIIRHRLPLHCPVLSGVPRVCSTFKT